MIQFNLLWILLICKLSGILGFSRLSLIYIVSVNVVVLFRSLRSSHFMYVLSNRSITILSIFHLKSCLD
jgi:hypothetical protein